MTNSAKDIIGAIDGKLSEEFSINSGDTKTHEVDTPTLSFRTKGGWPHSWPYHTVRSSRHTKEGITVKTHDAIIRIGGKNLEQLYDLIRRWKINEIEISSRQVNESDQPFLESISIYYTDEEITYEGVNSEYTYSSNT